MVFLFVVASAKFQSFGLTEAGVLCMCLSIIDNSGLN